MKLIKLLTLACFVGMAFASCSDGGSPELTITSPDNGTTYAAGDTIVALINVADDEGVLSLNVLSNALGINGSFMDFNGALNDNVEFKLGLDPLTTAGDYDITFTVFDLENNTDDEVLSITVQ